MVKVHKSAVGGYDTRTPRKKMITRIAIEKQKYPCLPYLNQKEHSKYPIREYYQAIMTRDIITRYNFRLIYLSPNDQTGCRASSAQRAEQHSR